MSGIFELVSNRYSFAVPAGIILIRYAGLPLMRKEAERRPAAVGEGQPGLDNVQVGSSSSRQ